VSKPQAKPIPVTFKLYPEAQRGLFYVVKVWPSRTAMLTHLRSIGKKDLRGTQAMCSSYVIERWKNGRKQVNPNCGEINVHRKRLDSEIAAHEIGHAVVQWARRRGIDPMSVEGDVRGHEGSENERFCRALGRMVAQFANHTRRRKIWTSL
jgi:hypothetical protein